MISSKSKVGFFILIQSTSELNTTYCRFISFSLPEVDIRSMKILVPVRIFKKEKLNEIIEYLFINLLCKFHYIITFILVFCNLKLFLFYFSLLYSFIYEAYLEASEHK